MSMTKCKNERLAKGWSQQTLGFYANVSGSDISRIESGRMIPYPAQAERIAKILGLKPGELQEPASTTEQAIA
jgi:transcriptional regulator with XRE-family HTH domain